MKTAGEAAAVILTVCKKERGVKKNILYYPVCLGILLLNAIKKRLVL